MDFTTSIIALYTDTYADDDTRGHVAPADVGEVLRALSRRFVSVAAWPEGALVVDGEDVTELLLAALDLHVGDVVQVVAEALASRARAGACHQGEQAGSANVQARAGAIADLN